MLLWKLKKMDYFLLFYLMGMGYDWFYWLIMIYNFAIILMLLRAVNRIFCN